MEQLDAAHNLARWLTRNDQDAQDVVQEACLKAMRAFESFRGGDFRAWFLTIVRNTSFTWMRRDRSLPPSVGQVSMEEGVEVEAESHAHNPQALTIRAADVQLVRQAIAALPIALRETVVLREMEGLSYKEIGKITGVPIGTVMSRLSRGRSQLEALLLEMGHEDARQPAGEGKI